MLSWRLWLAASVLIAGLAFVADGTQASAPVDASTTVRAGKAAPPLSSSLPELTASRLTGSSFAGQDFRRGDKSFQIIVNGCNGTIIRAIAQTASGDLLVGGYFSVCTDAFARNIARYTPSSNTWTSLGFGAENGVDGPVTSIAVDGDDIYVAGYFRRAGSVQANCIAKWSQGRWSSLGVGPANGTDAAIQSLVVRDGEVFVAGEFSRAGGQPASKVAVWRNGAWSDLGMSSAGGVDQLVRAIHRRGNDILIGGDFSRIGNVPAQGIARWDGSTWHALDGGVRGHEPQPQVFSVQTIQTDNDTIYAGGYFGSAGGIPAQNIAAWTNGRWRGLGEGSENGVNSDVRSLSLLGGRLFVGGQFGRAGGLQAQHAAIWENGRWISISGPGSEFIGGNAMQVLATPDGAYFGGLFSNVGPLLTNRMAKWTNGVWSPLGVAVGNGIGGVVHALLPTHDGVYVGGYFGGAGQFTANNIARWNGVSWESLSGPSGNGTDADVRAIASYQGSIYVGGYFGRAGGKFVRSLARWDGQDWHALGQGNPGVDSAVTSLLPIGPDLYVGGAFLRAGDVPASNIAIWNGAGWRGLGSGVGYFDGRFSAAETMVLVDGKLYVGGFFDRSGQVAANNIAMWDGTSWNALIDGGVNGLDGIVQSLAAKDGIVYAGGNFWSGGGKALRGIARWNGVRWEALGEGVNGMVRAVIAHGDDVIVSGDFSHAGNVPANKLARWNGSAWFGMGTSDLEQSIRALAVQGGTLIVGGMGLFETPLPALQSKPPAAQIADAPSDNVIVSRNGARVAFSSRATNLAAGDSDALSDIYLRDPVTGVITRASAVAESINGGAEESFDDPSLSSNGASVAFTGSTGQIYLVQGDVGRRINVNTGGAPGNGAARNPVVRGPESGDRVYFDSSASNLVANDGNGPVPDVFVFDLATGRPLLLSTGANGEAANGPSSKPDASDDGSIIAFTTRATNIVPSGSTPNIDQIVSLAGSTKSYISRNVNTGQTGNANSRNVRLTPDGRFGVFESDASNLVANDTNGVTDIFWFERVNGQVARLERVSVSRFGIQANGPSRNPSISDDGQYVTFETDATNLIELDRNGVTDILVRWMVTGEVLRLSRTVDGEQPNGHSTRPMISGDGSTIVFGSDARNLTANDTNNARDVFSVRLREPAPAVVVVGPRDEPSLTSYTLPTPNPANASCPAGFFIASVDDGPGSGLTPGIFGVEILLDAPGTRLLDGGLNFGGLIDAGQVGFAGFNFTNPANELQRVTLSLTGNPASSTSGSLPVRISLIRQTTAGNTTVFDTTRTINLTTPYVTSIDLTPGFYVATVAATGGTVGGAAEGQFFLGMQTSFVNRPGGGFQGGAVVGGYHAQNPAGGPSGFAGFCLGTQHSTSIRVLSRPTYGEAGAKDLRLRLQDAQQRVLVDVPAG